MIYDIVEMTDLKAMDLRFRWRGPETPDAKVGLLTIDDRSIEEVGRWPWSREKTAFVVDQMMKFGAKAIGFDIVFSEPQTDPSFETLSRIESKAAAIPVDLKHAIEEEKKKSRPDATFASTVSKFKEKLILGAFNEESSQNYIPYQDYCRNEAFKRANAEQFVKLNSTFIVDDADDDFVDVEFDKVFSQIFPVLERITTERALNRVFKKNNVAALDTLEARKLKFIIEDSNMDYCDHWLTKSDNYLEPLKQTYTDIFSKSKLLQSKSFEAAIEAFKSSVKTHPIIQHRRWTINTPEIQSSADYTASFNAEQDTDGTIRKASLFFRTGNRIGTSFIPSLALQTFLSATGMQARIEIDKNPKSPDQKILTKFQLIDTSKEPEVVYADVPVDGQGRLKINYAGGPKKYPYLPAKELFNDKPTATVEQRVWDTDLKKWIIKEFEVNKADFIKDRTFIFGATAIGVYDLRVTPFEKNFPGPETHVNALGNLFMKNFIHTYPDEHRIMLIVLALFGAILSLAIAQTGAISGFIITAVAAAAIIEIDSLMFKNGFVATMVLPFFLVVFMYTFLTFYKYLTEERKKKHLRSTFSKYVSPAIVDEILKDPENIELGGKKQRMSVFFSDVRGFTTISEKLDPQVLSDVLTKYLTPMTQIVFANKGTLDKYMGDALMAFFGAPIFFPEHAKAACKTALQSLQKLKEIQSEFLKQGLPAIEIGIGINSAEMSVGNMGSDIVRNYTVMGDAVNLASRLEGINKEYGTRVVISQFTYEDLKDAFTARELDWVRVKGKNEPVKIYELICEGTASPDLQKGLKFFEVGFNLYHDKKFLEAKSEFQKSHEMDPRDPVAKLYIERCDEYLTEPPPPNWDGVFVMKTK
jgi:adenylate cyclase